MTRMATALEDERGNLEDAMTNLKRNGADIDLAILRLHQAIQRQPGLYDLLTPAIDLLSAAKRRDNKAINFLSKMWIINWKL